MKPIPGIVIRPVEHNRSHAYIAVYYDDIGRIKSVDNKWDIQIPKDVFRVGLDVPPSYIRQWANRSGFKVVDSYVGDDTGRLNYNVSEGVPMKNQYYIRNITAIRVPLLRKLRDIGAVAMGGGADAERVDIEPDQLQSVIDTVQELDTDGNVYITDKSGKTVYDPKDGTEYKSGNPQTDVWYNKSIRTHGSDRIKPTDKKVESRKSMSEATPEERRAIIRKAQGKIDYKVGDSVVITVDGLKKHSRSIPAHMGYSQATIDWRGKLSKLADAETVGTVERVFPGGNNLNVDFDGYLTQVPSYMVKPAADNSESKMTTETYRNKKYSAMLRLMEKYENEMTTEYEMSRDERGAFLETLRGYQNYGNIIYRTNELAKAVDEIAQLIETAGNFTLKETDGWFDNVTANRHTKQMKEALKILQTEAKEIMQRQQRLEAAYEDIGQLLGRYYDI